MTGRLALLSAAVLIFCLGSQCTSPPPGASGGGPAVTQGTGGAGTGGTVAVGQAGETVTPPPAARCRYTEQRSGARAARAGVQTKVIGGSSAPPGVYPWMAALTTHVGHQYCGGSVVSDKIVLTASHCQGAPGDKVVVGRLDLRTDAGQVRTVERSMFHAYYRTPSEGFDVSLLLLDQPLVDVEPVRLAEAGSVPTEDTATVIGWGLMDEGGQASPVLLEAAVPLIQRADCVAQYGALHPTTICADGPGKGTCQGDSGGPQMAGGVQIGVTSYGHGCARPDWPGVYASVAAMRDTWIDPCIKEIESW